MSDLCCCCCKAISLSSLPLWVGQCNHPLQGSPWLEFTFLWNGNDWPKVAHHLYQTSAGNPEHVTGLLNPGPPENVGRVGGSLKKKSTQSLGNGNSSWQISFLLQQEPLLKPQENIHISLGKKLQTKFLSPCPKNLPLHHYNLLFTLAFSKGNEAVTRDSPVLCQGALHRIKFAWLAFLLFSPRRLPGQLIFHKQQSSNCYKERKTSKQC